MPKWNKENVPGVFMCYWAVCFERSFPVWGTQISRSIFEKDYRLNRWTLQRRYGFRISITLTQQSLVQPKRGGWLLETVALLSCRLFSSCFYGYENQQEMPSEVPWKRKSENRVSLSFSRFMFTGIGARCFQSLLPWLRLRVKSIFRAAPQITAKSLPNAPETQKPPHG